jgi:hypothetical protein
MKTLSLSNAFNSAVSVSPRSIIDVHPHNGRYLDSYFLANRTMTLSRTSNSLIASSFGANSILYAAWLGYIMGFWALLIHAAWCLSFVLLARFSTTIFKHTSLNDFLGCRFGRITQSIAAICSIIGILYFAGWEIAIAKSGVESLLIGIGINIDMGLPIVFSLVVFSALLYVGIGGRKANGIADSIFNPIKYILLIIVVFILISRMASTPNLNTSVMFPNFSTAITAIGLFGFITNFIFNLSWQFIDNSSWQSISSGSKSKKNSANKSILMAGGGVFIAYMLSMTLGVFLRQVPDLNSDNILGGIASFGEIGILACVIFLLLISMVSLIDGIGLSVAQTVLVDLRVRSRKENSFLMVRLFTIAVGIFSAWGVQTILNLIGANIFDFVYIFIIVQLSLLGPVLVGLLSKNETVRYIWCSIIFGIAAGIFASVGGEVLNLSWLSEAAGAISAITSTLVAVLLCYCGFQNMLPEYSENQFSPQKQRLAP